MENSTGEHEAFLQSLHTDAKTYGHSRRAFLGKKGDVLVWHADLANGGSAVTSPGRSRKSLVTHFTPGGDQPFYARSSQYRTAEEHGCVFSSQYRDIAVAPKPHSPRSSRN